jgi:hypothetical protein
VSGSDPDDGIEFCLPSVTTAGDSAAERLVRPLRHDYERHGAVASEAYRDRADNAVTGVGGTADHDHLVSRGGRRGWRWPPLSVRRR